MNKKLAYFLIVLTASSGTNANETDSSKEKNSDLHEWKIEKSGIGVRTQNLIGSLVKRGALIYDNEKQTIDIDLTKLTDAEMKMYVKSNETNVDFEEGSISLLPEFSKFIIEKEMLKINELLPSQGSDTDEEIMERLLQNVSPDIGNDIARFEDHSFA